MISLIAAAKTAGIEHLRPLALWPVMATILTGPRNSAAPVGRIFVRNTSGRLLTSDEHARKSFLP